ncbi:BNR-4 repeat-containing protein [Pelagicoccus mobilis]|uniref:BNR-4 repeat-containing protein n=1 Tax=Pelagicoccus mobilis TaxID=415221 RepID=A0A934RT79_9BACT|nr:BNR-4 repeat-containing protein [Pelagicoccus mobilis]MBK1876437.1 BNR-4 repeat-containing protein [Pelagicoccus mobilis]
MTRLLLKTITTTLVCAALCSCNVGKVELIDSVKISDLGLYFDGQKVKPKDGFDYPDSPKYDYAYGPRITPHGDCIEVYGDYVFMTWYKGPEAVRNVMLSRYNMKTGSLVTVEFDHRHTGFVNNPHIGESHNTIAVGICPIDDTIHLLYDMHAYGPTKPLNGTLSNDYFRYQISEKGAAVASDEQFSKQLFGPKRLYLKKGEDYTHLTYPYFHINEKDELFVRIRRGGHNNGKYMLAKYDGESWSDFWDFNILSASEHGHPHDWGLYGDLKFENGKLRAGFETRLAIETDKYKYNNGFHYAYSNDPEGRGEWFTHKGEPVALPIIDPTPLKFYEPGDLYPDAEPNSLYLTQGTDWTVTEDDSIHFINDARHNGKSIDVHAYKKAGEKEFKVSTEVPGGQLYSVGSTVYLIGLENGYPYVSAAQGGTNDWKVIYQAAEGPLFKHGNAIIRDGKLYYFLMENGEGSAQPIHLLIYDLGL